MDPIHHVYELKNGMKVVIIPRKMSGLVHVSMVMRNGFVDETKHSLSFTHMGEHLFAKYTSKKFPRYESVKGRLGFLGIENNAYTTKFTTGYWMLGQKKHLQTILTLLSTSYFDYKFTDDWFKQRNILIEEVKQRNSGTFAPLDEVVRSTLYENHRLGVSWKDEVKCISKASAKDVIAYNQKKRQPHNTIVLIEGDIEAGLIFPDVQSMFETIPSKAEQYALHVPRAPDFVGPKLIRKQLPIHGKTSKLIYTYQLKNMSCFDKKLESTLFAMLKYFCHGYYSRLSQILREKHGLIYGIESDYFMSPRPDDVKGCLQFSMHLDQSNITKVMDIVTEEIDRLKKFVVPRKEMLRLKNSIQFQRSMDLLTKTPGKYAENCAYYMIWDKPVQSFSEYYDLLKKVTSREIQGLSKRVFKKEHELIVIGESA
jgi:zinc protease